MQMEMSWLNKGCPRVVVSRVLHNVVECRAMRRAIYAWGQFSRWGTRRWTLVGVVVTVISDNKFSRLVQLVKHSKCKSNPGSDKLRNVYLRTWTSRKGLISAILCDSNNDRCLGMGDGGRELSMQLPVIRRCYAETTGPWKWFDDGLMATWPPFYRPLIFSLFLYFLLILVLGFGDWFSCSRFWFRPTDHRQHS